MEEITFTSNQVFVTTPLEQKLLSKSDISAIELNKNFIFNWNNISYDFNFELELERFLWISIKYGNPSPCPQNVYDKKKNTYRNNPRTEDLVEMRHQVFALYDLETSCFYTNNSMKKNVIACFFKENYKLEIEFRKIYQNIDVFKEKVSRLKTINFTSSDDLFSTNAPLNAIFRDMLCHEAPIDFTLEINCTGKILI